jgi:hypothetical protein
MNFRERTLRTFQKRKIDKIVWQPRIYCWYYGNRLKNKLPEGYKDRSILNSLYNNIQPYKGNVPQKYKDKTMVEIYDDLNASPRYPQEVLGVSIFKFKNKKVKIEFRDNEKEGKIITIYKTPLGSLREVKKHGYHTEYPLKILSDLEIMEYILADTEFEFDMEAFKVADRKFGERGVIQTFYPRSPLQRLIIDYMSFERTIYALNDYPDKIKNFLRVIEEWDDKMYEVILNSPVKILNFGENIDAAIDSPLLFKEYLVPYYKKRINQIHQKGKFCHIHMDGSLKPLLPFIKRVGFDGVEAATPLPQGDVSLEELKDALEGTILLDGIPAILFLPRYSYQDLEKFTIKVLEMFSPHLILGVSDEVPPTADIEKVKFVSELVDNFNL